MRCGNVCQNFGRLFESTTIVEETEGHQSCKQYPDLSQVVSAARSAVGADDVLWRRKASRKGRDSTLPSAEVIDDGRIGDGARRDQPAPAATMAPQPIFNEEIMENTESKEFEDIQSGNIKENCGSFVLSSCDAEFNRRQSQGWEDPRSGVGDEENYEEFESEESEVEEENYEETDDRPYLLVKLLSQLFDTAGSNDIGDDCEESMNATWLNRPVSVAWPNRLANTYKEPTSTFSGYEESEIEVGKGLEEPRGDVRSEVRWRKFGRNKRKIWRLEKWRFRR